MVQLHIRCFSEFWATTTLLLLGSLGCLVKGSSLPLLQSSMAYGFTFTGILHCFPKPPVPHGNPCVTLAAWLMGEMEFLHMLVYWLAQFAAAFCSSLMLTVFVDQNNSHLSNGLFTNTPLNELQVLNVFLVECVLTSALIMAWCRIWTGRRTPDTYGSTPIVMGLLSMGLCLAGGNLTGANLNPAKTCMFAYYLNAYDYLKVYISAHLLAAVIVPIGWKIIYCPLMKKERRD